MGYFNIFYKITRIIDMLTRKRNRKFIIILLIIIGIVFFYHNKVNAQEDDLQYNQNFTHAHIRLNSDGTVQYGTINTTNMYYSLVFPVKEGFTYKGSCTSAPADSPLKVGFVSDLDNMIYTMNPTENSSSINYGPGAVSIYGIYNSTSGFEITADADGYFIIGGFRPGSSAFNYNDCGFQVYTDYNGQSNLNTINQDLLRIEELLKDYLYGDVESYDVPYKNGTIGLAALNNRFAYQNNTTLYTYYFEVKNGYDYKITFDDISNDHANWYVRFGYCSDVPRHDLPINNVSNLDNVSNNTIEFTGNTSNGKYYYINFYIRQIKNIAITSNYNYGQEYGLYGGLTDINEQTKQQGEQTRDTITSTDYNSEDVNINTDSISNIDSGQTEGLFTTIFNNFNDSVSGGIDEIIIPMPNGAGNITLRSDIVSSHIGNLSVLVSAFWYFVFGFYAFKFVNNLLHNIKDGSILDGFKNNNEVITQDML